MDVDEIVDALAFGAKTEKVSACLGMYIGPETIYIAETHLEKGKLIVDHLVRIPVPAPEAGKGGAPGTGSTLNTDFLMDNAKLSALIKQSMAQVRWNTKDVMLTLSHHLGLLRYFAMPEIERRYWNSSVPLEAKKYIPIPFDVLSYDYQVVSLPPDANGKNRQGALVAVTQKKNLSNLTALLASLGLRLVGMEVAPCSALRLWESLDKACAGKAHCQVHFDGGNIRIMLADKGLPVFFRELFLGADASLGEFRKVDLGGCLAFAQKQLGVGNLSQLRVSGTNGAISAWADAFTQEVGTQAQTQDTAGMLGIKGGDWGGYASIGASMRYLQPSTLVLDLGKVGKITDEERRTAKSSLAIMGTIAVFFAVTGVFNNMMFKYKERVLAKYRRPPEVEAIFTGKGKNTIEAMLKGMQSQTGMSQNLNPESSVKTTALLKDVVESLPEKVWLTSLTINNPVVAGTTGITMDLWGHAVAATLGEEQELCLSFRDKLQKSPLVGKTFKDFKINVDGKPMTFGPNEGLDPDALTKKLEERTQFHLVATSKI
jgi:hypothetical protein